MIRVPWFVGRTPLHWPLRRLQAAAVQAPVSHAKRVVPVTLIPGDGVGPELSYAIQEVVRASAAPVQFEEISLSEVNPHISQPLPDVVASLQKNGIGIAGVVSAPYYSHAGEAQSLNTRLRIKLDLFAHVAHIKSLPGVRSRHRNIDFLIIREQQEGEHLALEHESVTGVIECLKVTSREQTQRIAKFAFDFAVKHKRRKVTAVHKANIMKLTDGMFLETCREVAELYPQIEFNDVIVDNCTMQMVSKPHQFDVLVMPNLYGDILDNLAAGLVGGAGVVSGESYSADTVLFEPGARHTYSEAVGKNIANPTAMLLCTCQMLRHVNLEYHSTLIRDAVLRSLKKGKVRTRDMGGHATTTDFVKEVIRNFRSSK